MRRPYSLTLSKSERRAIDWVGYRYRHGDDLAEILCDGEVHGLELYDMTTGEAWEELSCDLTFHLMECEAHMIHEIVEEDPQLTCFAENLTFKFLQFCDQIV